LQFTRRLGRFSQVLGLNRDKEERQWRYAWHIKPNVCYSDGRLYIPFPYLARHPVRERSAHCWVK